MKADNFAEISKSYHSFFIIIINILFSYNHETFYSRNHRHKINCDQISVRFGLLKKVIGLRQTRVIQ